MKCGCILMAAGLSARFGENKLLHEMDGRPIFEWTARAVPAALFARAVAVVSDTRVQAMAERAGYTAIVNEEPARGQGSSIALGMRAMAEMDAVLFCVADQPYLREDSVRRLLAAWNPGDIVALAFDGKRGNPILFPSVCFAELEGLAPEETGRAVIARHPHRLKLVEAKEARELADIDTKKDLRK